MQGNAFLHTFNTLFCPLQKHYGTPGLYTRKPGGRNRVLSKKQMYYSLIHVVKWEACIMVNESKMFFLFYSVKPLVRLIPTGVEPITSSYWFWWSMMMIDLEKSLPTMNKPTAYSHWRYHPNQKPLYLYTVKDKNIWETCWLKL